ncbi:MAG TPA: flagellar basal body-associated FliL family protein [Marmoricola sp.]|jgi:flagellar FliL protein
MTVTAIPPKTAGAAGADEAPGAKAKKSRKKLIVILVAVLAIGAGAYWFVLKPKPASSAPKPGDVVKLDPIQINLAGTHYLRVGIALQLVAGTKEAEGSKALDATIDEFSGKDMADVNDPARRDAYKKELVKELEHRYEGDVMGVYFTEFVTQ